MKKRRSLILLFLLVISSLSFSVDFSGEINAERNAANNSETEYNTNAKLAVEYQEEDMFAEITVSADTADEEQELEIYRAYTELYKDNWTLTLGRQKIVWGSAFLFNMSDVINTPDPSDPRGDKKGTDSIKLKYNTSDMSRIEVVGFDNDADGDNFAARYTFLLNNYEFMLNYFDYELEIMNQINEVKTGVLEFKGDLLVGIWSQLVFQEINNENYEYLVLGTDYSFEINENTLYILAESLYNNDENKGVFYLRYNYTFSEDMNFGQSYVGAMEGNSGILYNNFEYLFNDYITMNFGINLYNNMEEFSGLNGLSFEDDLKNELNFKISTYF